jgi:hypothetical protein
MADIPYREIQGCKFRAGHQLGGTCYMAAANAVFATSYAFEYVSNNPDVENYIRGYSDSHLPSVYGSTTCPMIPNYIGDLYNDMELLFVDKNATLRGISLFTTVITLNQTTNKNLPTVLLHETTEDTGHDKITVSAEKIGNDYFNIYQIWNIFGRNLNMTIDNFDELQPFNKETAMVGGGFPHLHLLALLLASGSTPTYSRAKAAAVDYAIDNYVTTTFPTVLTLNMRIFKNTLPNETNQLKSIQDRDFFWELYKVSEKISSRSNCLISGIVLSVAGVNNTSAHAFQLIPCKRDFIICSYNTCYNTSDPSYRIITKQYSKILMVTFLLE